MGILRKMMAVCSVVFPVVRIIPACNRSFEGTGEIVLPNGDIAVSAEGKYMKVNIEKIAGISEVDDNWFLLHNKDDPLTLEIPEE